MVDHHPIKQQDEDLRWQRIATKFQYSFMSNTKWRKVLFAIEDSGIEIHHCQYKWIDSKIIFKLDGFPKANRYLDRYFADGPTQPIEYRWMEWIGVPRFYYPRPQIPVPLIHDLEQIKQIIMAAADAYVTIDQDQLTLYGYRGQQ